jgi:transposase
MMKKTIIQPDYTAFGSVYQLALPMDIGEIIPNDDSVRLLSAIMERIDYTKLLRAYSRLGRIETSPKNLFKILVYGYMSGIFSSRKLERSCQRDINFMYLLGREPAPDHSTIARFRSERLSGVLEELFAQLIMLLKESGEISLETQFIDGTKLEASAGRYTFVWKKSVGKHEDRMQDRMKEELPKLAEQFGARFWIGEKVRARDLKKLRKRLKRIQIQEGIKFVHGSGKRKPPLQKAIETVESFLERQKQYDDYNHSFGDRNSFSKTDRDATFMRLKEDHMRNGQLKPAYNVVIGVDSEYIVGALISQERSESKTLIPYLEKYGGGYKNVVADAGLESEENYTYLEAHEQLAFIKPSNYEQSKTKKYKSDIGRRENMPYDAETDTYVCHMGRRLWALYERKTKSTAGFPIMTTVYECENCAGCPHNVKCIKPGGKQPIEERTKRLYVSKEFQRQRAEAEARITSDEGILLRTNRSIQVEGAFGVLKDGMGFRQFLMRGKVKVEIEFLLLCMAYNVNKLHNKIQSERCGKHLHVLKAA